MIKYLLGLFEKKESEKPKSYYTICKIKQKKFYGLCGIKVVYVAYNEDYLCKIGFKYKGELVCTFLSEDEMLDYNPVMVLEENRLRTDFRQISKVY